MNSRINNHIALVMILFLAACSPALYLPTIEDANQTGISTDSLILGRSLYVNHCGSCHNLLPEQYTSKHWQQKMPEMQLKAKISDENTKLITNFILARSKPE